MNLVQAQNFKNLNAEANTYPAITHSSNAIYIVGNGWQPDGYRYLLLKSSDEGNSWTNVLTGPKGSSFSSVVFAGDTGFVIANVSSLYRTFNGGQTWDTVKSFGSYIYGYSVMTINNGKTYLAIAGSSAGPSETDSIFRLYVSNDYGDSWSLKTIDSNYFKPQKIIMNGDSGFIIGNDYSQAKNGHADAALLRTVDGGKSWKKEFVDCFCGSILSIDMQIADGWIYVLSDLLPDTRILQRRKITDIGWESFNLNLSTGAYIEGFLVNDNNLYLVGDNGRAFRSDSVNEPDFYLISLQFKPLSVPVMENLLTIDFFKGNYYVGMAGFILKSDDIPVGIRNNFPSNKLGDKYFYNLLGQPVSDKFDNLPEGVYIKDGHKILKIYNNK